VVGGVDEREEESHLHDEQCGEEGDMRGREEERNMKRRR